MRYVVRSQEPPASLAKRKRYDGEDVRKRLREDFAGCCYLCEGPLPRGWEVEHLRPKSVFEERKFDWSNLYPACGICNRRRRKWGEDGWPEGGMLDPTRDSDIEWRLLQRVELAENVEKMRILFAPLARSDQPAQHTASELDPLHNSEREDSKQLRGEILARLTAVLQKLVRLHGSSGDRRAVLIAEVRLLIAPTAPYATPIRSYLRESGPVDPRLCEEIGL